LATTRLNRGLSDEFVSELLAGAMAPILAAARSRDLDFQIREDYVNLYHRGLSLLKLSQQRAGAYRAQIHVEYLRGVELPGETRRDEPHAVFAADSAFAEAWAAQLQAITANSDDHAHREAEAEQALVRNSLLPASPLAIIDRQVQVHGIGKRADVIGLTCEAEPRFVIAEVKRGLNNGIQKIPEQLAGYRRVLAGADGRLRDECCNVYRRVVEQKRRLGILPDSVVFPQGRPEVECLAILCDYNPNSRLLDRARRLAQGCGFTIRRVEPAAPDYELPPRPEWSRL